MPRSIKTSAKDIVGYWSSRIDECDIGVDWAEALERCWRCSAKTILHRAHIVPHSLGGLDEPSNMVLLCNRCHGEAPNVRDSDFLWVWLKSDSAIYYDTFWILKGVGEYKRIYGKNPFEGFCGNADSVEIKTAIEFVCSKASRHFGQQNMNPSTCAWIIREIEKN